MNTLEVLTLVLVIFAALSYIDDHNNKGNQSLVGASFSRVYK